jgi:hypothetical protein
MHLVLLELGRAHVRVRFLVRMGCCCVRLLVLVRTKSPPSLSLTPWRRRWLARRYGCSGNHPLRARHPLDACLLLGGPEWAGLCVGYVHVLTLPQKVFFGWSSSSRFRIVYENKYPQGCTASHLSPIRLSNSRCSPRAADIRLAPQHDVHVCVVVSRPTSLTPPP